MFPIMLLQIYVLTWLHSLNQAGVFVCCSQLQEFADRVCNSREACLKSQFTTTDGKTVKKKISWIFKMYFHHLLFLWLHQHSKPFICENLKQIFLETEESGWKKESKNKKHDLFFRVKEQLRDSCSTITQSRQQSCVISAHILSCIQLLYTPRACTQNWFIGHYFYQAKTMHVRILRALK